SIFAHAYHYVEPDPPERMPESILRPWQQITRRLQRPAPHLSFIDLNVYNWRLIDPHCPDPMRAENLALLIAILGNEDERRFQTVPIEMLAQFTPVVGAVVRAQEAVARDDAAALKVELIAITDALMQQAYVSLMKVNPNAYSKLYVNPVVWGKTVAPLATPYQLDPPPGPSGTAIPAYQLLDTFFGRQHYRSNIGHETARVRQWFPPHWQQFLAAVERISVPEYVSRQGSTTLKGLFREAVDAYAGDTGLLGRHRLKTFGFLDLSFKAGRSKTLGGFGGGFDDRLWDKMDSELDLARLERYTGSPQAHHHVTVKRSERLYADAAGSTRQVVLDAGDAGIRYQPGDRCAILPENGDELVERTLRALRARGDEPIQLNTVWRAAVQLRDGYAGAKILSLRSLLTFGRIRPVARPIAKALYTLTHNETLRRIIEARAEDQWELWALLDMLAEAGFNPRSLWKAHPGEHESICWIVPPESFRMYSLSSVMEEPSAESASELHLTVGRLAYRTRETEVSRDGTGFGTSSSFLARVTDMPADGQRRITIKLVHPPRFSLPKDAARPIVMFAAGTGLAPFRGLLQERARQAGAGENWLFFATRTRAELFYQDELSRMAAQGQLNLRVAFSQDDVDVKVADGGHLIFEPGSRRYIDAEILRDEHARRLWELLQSEEDGGLGAYIYICGRTGVAGSVMRAIKALLYRYAEGSEAERQDRARQTLFRLVGEDRYMQEIFTTYAGPQFEQRNTYDASEVVCHNHEQDGYWMIISGRVYDLTEFAHLHPGGLKIIRSYAGMDATNAYQKVLHDVNSEVDAMLGLYEIGAVRRLDFGSAWDVVIAPTGLRFVTLKDVYRAWIGLLYTVVEMENALHNDYGIRHEPVTYDENRDSICQSPYKTQLLLQTHQRFIREYLAKITGEPLQHLWAITSGLHSEGEDVRWMGQRIAAIQQSVAEGAARLSEEIGARLKELARADAVPVPEALEWCVDACTLLEEEDKRFMCDMKLALRTGVQVFERLESATIARGSGELMAAAQELPKILETYYARVVEGVPLTYPLPTSRNKHDGNILQAIEGSA
ncbi:MAG TPA: cytochrome b5 domain-containing protein, partial [Herpetosiphonaceae bacterium]|nr:cytochrome b5 domain-containing protein [Herpetosiphonaceae bacterium]